MAQAKHKECVRCRLTKPLTEFYKDSRASDGLQSACKECERNRSAYWKNQNKVKRLTQIKAYNAQRDKDKHRIEARVYYEQHKEEILERRTIWRVEKAEHAKAKMREYRRRRRAAKAGQIEHYTAAQWRALCATYGGQCLRCGKIGKLEPDHVIPLSKGGHDTIENIQPLCPSCNKRKHTKTVDYRKSWSGLGLGGSGSV